MNKRILLVEDNPVSREFLLEALSQLPVSIDVADTLAGACLKARQHGHDLFLCDVHLPDGNPETIFKSVSQCQPNTPIVAITAEANPAACSSLMETGYREVWGKPITIAVLQKNVCRIIGISVGAADMDIKHGRWDETTALRAVGNNAATLAALRGMFLAELPQQIKTIKLAYENRHSVELKGECHKLLASCGFVGAARLTHSVRQLSENPGDRTALDSVLIEAGYCLASD
jgi:CheY-like chemotaxis protein